MACTTTHPLICTCPPTDLCLTWVALHLNPANAMQVEDADEQMRARPPSGMSVNTLNCPASGLPAFQGSLPLPLPLVCSGAGAGDSPTRAVPAAARSAAPHGGMYMPPSHMDGTMSDPNSSVSAPTAAAVGVGSMSLQQQQSQAMAGPQMGVMPACSAAYGMQLPGATPGYLLGDYMDLMDEHPDGMQHHLQQQQQPMQQHMQQQPMQQAMQQQSCITSAGGQMVIVNGQQGAATTPNFHLQHQQAVGSPSAAAAVAAPPPVFARTSSPAPAGDPFSSLQARLPPLRTRLQQGWPDDVAAQVHSAPAGMVNAMLGPCTMAAGSLSGPNSEGAGPHLPDTLREHGGARGCSAYGAAPQPAFLAPHMMGGANKGAAQLASGANGGPFSQFGGAASAARFADGSEPSPTASIGRGVAALAMDSSPCTPVQKDSPVAVPPPQQHAGWQPEQGAALPAPNGAFCGSAGTSAAAAAAAAANINISPDEAFLDDPVLAGFWVMDTPHQQSGAPESGLPHPMLQQPQQQQLSCGSGLVVQVPHMPMQQQGPPMQLPYPGPMQQQMQQVAVQLQALQQQQQAMQQQLLMQQQQAAQMQQQQQQHSPRAGSTAAAAPNHPSPVSRERLLDALSAQISAMTPEMRVQLQLQLEASTAPSSAPAAAMAGQQQPAVATTDGSGCGGGGGGVAQRAQSVGAPPTNMLHGPSRLSATSPAITAGSDPSVVAAAASSCMPAPQQHQQASPSYVMPTMPPPGPASPAPAVAATSASPVPDCSSPLKRGPASRALGGAAFGQEDSGSPLKRHRGLPEPPSFATLVQTDLAADDAMAWALHASFNGTVHAAEGSTAAEAAAAAAVVLGDDDDTLAQLEDADWAPVD